ncbi:MAG: enoyl-CoA hydratase/isomerase family protein [Solirubrobacteraceae bacterium]
MRLNPLSAELTVQLHDALAGLAADPSVRVIVITGRDPGFSAGGDLKLMQEVGQRMLNESPAGAADIWRWIRGQFGGIARLIARTDKAFIAAVNGPTAGRWCQSIERLPEHVLAMSKPLLRICADMTWDQAITMEEFAEPTCFTTEAHRAAVEQLTAAMSGPR